jgi:cytolysin-activating lysine-acyltransferase
VHAALGQVVLALSVVPRYRHLALGELRDAVVEPLLQDRIAIASARAKASPDLSLAGLAFFATVSDAVEEKLKG